MGRATSPVGVRRGMLIGKPHTAAAAPVREGGQDHVLSVDATEGTGEGEEVPSNPPSELQEEAQDLRAVKHTTREKSTAQNVAERDGIRRRENTGERAAEAKELRKPGWRHIGRVPEVPDAVLTESNPSSRKPLQLPTEVCERIIDWLWSSIWMLQTFSLVCKAWTPRCRYWMQRYVALWDRSQVQGHARRARAQPYLLQEARAVTVAGGAKQGQRAPVPQLGTLAMMNAAKLPLMWRLDIQDALWKPGDFHPLLFVHLSAFSSVTTLRLIDVTLPKVREFGRLVCALPSLVCLKCINLLFTSTTPGASLAITRCPPSVRLNDLVVFSSNETSSDVDANVALIGHLCAAGVVADLQRFKFEAWASSDSKYLDVYREPIHELLKQCSQSLRILELSPNLHPGKDLQTDAVSDIIASVFDLAHCDRLETVALQALSFEDVGYTWMRNILKSNVSRDLREVSIVINRPHYSGNVEENLQNTVSALRKDMYPQLNELFSNKDYTKLHHVDFVFWTDPDEAIPDAARWASLLNAEMQELDERGVLRTRMDVYLNLWDEDSL